MYCILFNNRQCKSHLWPQDGPSEPRALEGRLVQVVQDHLLLLLVHLHAMDKEGINITRSRWDITSKELNWVMPSADSMDLSVLCPTSSISRRITSLSRFTALCSNLEF